MENKHKSQRVNFIKGFLALNIFIIHTGSNLRDFAYSRFIIDIGKFAIYGFFVLSAYLITLSILSKKNRSYFGYLRSRYLRIAPTYYFLLVVAILLARWFGVTPAGYFRSMMQLKDISWQDIIYHLTFVNVLDHRYIGSILGVEWTLPIEVVYYLLLPILVYLSTKSKWFLLVMGLTGILTYSYVLKLPIYQYVFGGGDWRFERYLFYYVIGVLFAFTRHFPGDMKYIRIIDLLILASLLSLRLLHNEKIEVVVLMVINYLLFRVITVNKGYFSRQPVVSGILMFVLILSTAGTILSWSQDATMALAFTLLSGMLLNIEVRKPLLEKLTPLIQPIAEIGRVSYPFYLSHLLVYTLVLSWILKIGTSVVNTSILVIIATMLITYVLSFTINRFIESAFHT